MTGIYVHIPFCRAKCSYCDFHSVTDVEFWPQYLDRMEAEMQQRTFDGRIDTVFVGGGTPSCLDAGGLCVLMERLRRHYDIASDAEITLEANPNSTNGEKLAAWHRAGFNRISFGMQSSDNATLRLIGRLHTHEQTVRAVQSARENGFTGINLDLIYGLPGQDLAAWERCLEAAIDLRPDHISCYALTLSPDVPMAAFHCPDSELQADMLETAVAKLAANDYPRYEISNFGKPCRHNLLYWHYQNWIGLGASAQGQMGTIRWENSVLPRYMDSFEEEVRSLSAEEQVTEAIMMGSRLAEGIRIDELCRRFAVKADDIIDLSVLPQLENWGLIQQDNCSFRLTDAGMSVQNSVLIRILKQL